MSLTSTMAGCFLTLVTLAACGTAASAQNPLRDHTEGVEIRFARTQPVVGYTLRVDAGDLSGFDVELRLRNVPDTFRLALVAHPEYDDRNWRFVEALRVETLHGAATVAREDSALWRVVATGGEALVRYRMRLPPPESPRAAWRPFLAATGGLVGGPHSFLYVVGGTLAPSHLTLELPPEWQIATGLEPTVDPHTFFAPTVGVLVDSPLLVGRLRSWRFAVDGVPHRVVYWPLPDAAPFDTAALVGSIERLSRQAVALFGRAPYRDYSFLLEDGAQGGLEHRSSVTLGAPSAELARDPRALLGELLGTMLDLIVRDATNGARSMDDVMRAMLERFSGERGFAGRDIERTVTAVCGCNVRPFFDTHVRGSRPIDFDRYLRLVGM